MTIRSSGGGTCLYQSPGYEPGGGGSGFFLSLMKNNPADLPDSTPCADAATSGDPVVTVAGGCVVDQSPGNPVTQVVDIFVNGGYFSIDLDGNKSFPAHTQQALLSLAVQIAAQLR